MDLEKCEVTMKLNGRAVKMIFDLLVEEYKNWPGGHPVEQENLQILKNAFYRAYMDCVFSTDDGES